MTLVTLLGGARSGKSRLAVELATATGAPVTYLATGEARDDEMTVSGGENVYPIEVEKALSTHPDVREASVIGVDDEQFGQ